MNRRDAIKVSAASWLGYALSASTVATIMSGCKTDQATELVEQWTPQLFSADQVKSLAQMAERIIPKTDTPGAKDVYVHHYIDTMVNDVFTQEEKEKFVKGLDDFMNRTQEKHGKTFDACTEAEQDALLQAAESADTQKAFFSTLKGLTVSGYCTSEEVGTNVLRYDPIPGNYDGCIPYEAGQRVWSLS